MERERKRERREKEIYKEEQGGGVIDGGHAKERERDGNRWLESERERGDRRRYIERDRVGGGGGG